MDKQRELALAEMCRVLDVSVSGGGKPEKKRLTDVQMLAVATKSVGRFAPQRLIINHKV